MLAGPLSRGRVQVASPALRVRWLDRQVAGYTLSLSGTLADLVAGWFILDHAGTLGILVHIPAVLWWTVGLHFLKRPGAPQVNISSDQNNAGRRAQVWKVRIASRLHSPELLALLLGLLLFPGLIPLGWCLGFGLARAQRIPRRTGFSFAVEETVPGEIPPDSPVADLAPGSSVRAQRAEITSLIDAMRDPSVDVRRGAIAILGQIGTADAVAMLRSLLTDSHADVRLDASITLARLEAKFNRTVNDAAKARSSSPSALRAYANQCLGYGCSGLLDPVTSRFYLTEASAALHAYLTHDAESGETWVMIARLHRNFGEMTEALRAINHAISLPDPSPEAFLLAMELAFHERKWETLMALATRARQVPFGIDDMDEKVRIMRWWTEMPGETPDSHPSGAAESVRQDHDERVAVATDETEIWSES